MQNSSGHSVLKAVTIGWSHFQSASNKPLRLCVICSCGYSPGGGGGTRSENCWGCAAGHWKLDPKRSREKWYFGAKKIEFCEDLYPKDRFCVGGWEKTPQKDRARSCQSEKRGSKPRHICITRHIGSTPPPPGATLIGSHLTSEPTASPVLTKRWNLEIMVATNFGSPYKWLPKLAAKFWLPNLVLYQTDIGGQKFDPHGSFFTQAWKYSQYACKASFWVNLALNTVWENGPRPPKFPISALFGTKNLASKGNFSHTHWKAPTICL